MSGETSWFAATSGPEGWAVLAGALLLGYALGSIPFGLILTRIGGAGDIRKVGSGNIGATNVLRTGRKGLALATLFCDAAKGFAPVLLLRLHSGLEPAMFAAAGAFLGHLFPVWLQFRGGKGVATFIGALTALYWPRSLLLRCVALHRAADPLFLAVGADRGGAHTCLRSDPVSPLLAAFVAALSALLIARHHQNIRNLIEGKESKISFQARSR